MVRRSAVAGLFLLCGSLIAQAPAAKAAMAIQDVTSRGGIHAWLVEDHSVPIVTLRLAFRGGSTQDPAGKEGIVNLMSGLMDEGAGDLDSHAFQQQLDDAGAEMRFDASRDAFYGSLRMLADQKDEALELLRLALTEPRFDQAPIDRIRAQIVSGIDADANDPSAAAQTAWSRALYGDHPYARREEGEKPALATVTPADLQGLHKRLFARSDLIIGVVGAIDAEALKRDLDKVFGALPDKAELVAVEDVKPKLDQQIRIAYDLPQTTLQLAYPGIARDDPQFFAAFLMNHILGGGSFTSRLFEEVRDKRGLAYSVDSMLINNDHSNGLVIATATRSDRAAETLQVIRDEVKRIVADGVTEEELAAAKKYVIGSYAINNLDTSNGIAGTMVELQLDDLGIDYVARRRAEIDKVTVADVNAAARRLLSTEPAVMVVGPSAPVGGKG